MAVLTLAGFVSTGTLPPLGRVAEAVRETFHWFRDDDGGECSDVYPAFERADRRQFAIAFTSVDGSRSSIGDDHRRFTLMSISKPFVLALVCEAVGSEVVRELVGVDATGLPFDSARAMERAPGGRTNPMVNPGAVATTALVPGGDDLERWAFVADGLSRFAGRDLELDGEVLDSAVASSGDVRSVAHRLHGLGGLSGDPDAAVELYTRQCCLAIDVGDLSTMGATLANGGTNPATGEVVVSPDTCHVVMASMATAGMYETSGTWLWRVGTPGSSGISGGIVTVSPGKGGLGTFAPPLDPTGNSVRGQLASEFLARELGLGVLTTSPAEPVRY